MNVTTKISNLDQVGRAANVTSAASVTFPSPVYHNQAMSEWLFPGKRTEEFTKTCHVLMVNQHLKLMMNHAAKGVLEVGNQALRTWLGRGISWRSVPAMPVNYIGRLRR